MNTQVSDKFAVIVHSCDRYEFLFQGFEYFFNQHWDFNMNCDYYFATENKDVAISNFKNIKSGSGEWADRLRTLLTEQINEKYVLYLQEDMWLHKKVSADFFNQLFDLAIKNNWNQVKLHSSGVYKTLATKLNIDEYNISKIDNHESDFLMSHQPTLWNKDFLIDQLHRNEHPWRNERESTKRLKKLNPEILQINYFVENRKDYNIMLKYPNDKIYYQGVSANGILNESVLYYIAELNNSTLNLKEYASQLEYNYNNQITHDGKAKPKKMDIFNLIKNKVKSIF